MSTRPSVQRPVMRRVGTDDLHRVVGCSSTMLLSGDAGASALFIAGRNGRTTRKRSTEEGAVPRQGGPCKIASTPCFAPCYSPCFGTAERCSECP